MRRLVLYFLALGLPTAFAQMPSPAAPPAASPQKYTLKATPKTVAWGYYDASAAPVLRIHSGDSVEFETLLTKSPTGLEKAGLPPEQVQQNLRDIYKEVTDKGPGGHILNGPVYIEEAEPGDTLEIRIEKIDLAIPYAYNGFAVNRGFLPEDFPYRRIKIIPLDRERMVAKFAPGIEIPLHPFFGSMGVAPPEAAGRVDSAPPGVHAGNMDNKELVAGTTLYLPVHVKGGLFEIGDGHAAQGNGEVDITAIETSLIGKLQFIVHKGKTIPWPWAESPTHIITMGDDRDLNAATHIAVRQMIRYLMDERKLSQEDAYMLCSVAAD